MVKTEETKAVEAEEEAEIERDFFEAAGKWGNGWVSCGGAGARRVFY
jgi:hypothetical protein